MYCQLHLKKKMLTSISTIIDTANPIISGKLLNQQETFSKQSVLGQCWKMPTAAFTAK